MLSMVKPLFDSEKSRDSCPILIIIINSIIIATYYSYRNCRKWNWIHTNLMIISLIVNTEKIVIWVFQQFGLEDSWVYYNCQPS